MNIERLKKVKTIQEFFQITDNDEISEGTRLFLEAMRETDISAGQDIVTYGADSEDGMYIILEGTADVYSSQMKHINTLGVGDFIGELGLINDDKRAATVRARDNMVCANISKNLFDDIATLNRKVYGTFMNMLYTKTTKLVTEQERIKSELSIATQIQTGCLENDFSDFNKLPYVKLTARMRPAKEVGGDFYDTFMIDDSHLCFLIADVSGKGIPAAMFMSMAKTHIKNYATLGLPLSEVAARTNNQLCYKNEAAMFVTAFICVLDLDTDRITYINAGHNRPFIQSCDGDFAMLNAKANLVLGIMEGVPYKEQYIDLKKGDSIYLYTDGVTEALNPKQELLGDEYLCDMLNKHKTDLDDVDKFVDKIYDGVDAFADGETQADDITMVLLSRR